MNVIVVCVSVNENRTAFVMYVVATRAARCAVCKYNNIFTVRVWNILHNACKFGSGSSSAGMVTWLRVGQQEGLWIRSEGLSSKTFKMAATPHSLIGTRAPFPKPNRPMRGADHSTECYAKIQDAWSLTSTSSYAFIVSTGTTLSYVRIARSTL